MALDIDGYAVLGAVAMVPEVFPDIRADIARTARGLVVKQLKAKTLPLGRLRLIRRTLGAETFALIVDGMTDAETKAIVARLDAHHPELKTATADWCRRRLVDLADADEPAEKPRAAKAASAKPKPERALGKRPFAATWDGKDYDAPGIKRNVKSKSRGQKKG